MINANKKALKKDHDVLKCTETRSDQGSIYL